MASPVQISSGSKVPIGSSVRSETRLLDLLLSSMPGIKEGSRHRILFTRFHVLTPNTLTALASISMLRCLPRSRLTGVTVFSPRRKPDRINISHGTLFEAVVENERSHSGSYSIHRHVSASARPSFNHHSGLSGFNSVKSSRGYSFNHNSRYQKRNGARYVKGTVCDPNQLYFAIYTAGP